MVYSCENHIDEAIEEVVDQTGLPPQLELVDGKLGENQTCFLCGESAKYVISG
ncbi:CxxH/CxxC protein [Evansella sp. AB-P1]|uniref:CxxH/CxxC protein n=1 Tax=Evansella sp. AB-P1 TaxID=3037653 RepID=UPI0024201C94|nr:CxxH/CxxC protein [Evansella sp. AB-P1]MDG5789435.1 CxxH/CxxC protein [Evansella sp. AB-P1]